MEVYRDLPASQMQLQVSQLWILLIFQLSVYVYMVFQYKLFGYSLQLVRNLNAISFFTQTQFFVFFSRVRY